MVWRYGAPHEAIRFIWASKDHSNDPPGDRAGSPLPCGDESSMYRFIGNNQTDWEQLQQRISECKNVQSSFLMGLKSPVLRTYPQGGLTADFASYLMSIITPRHAKASHGHSLTEEEREENSRVVQLMTTFGMSYLSEQEVDPITHERTLVYRLDP